ncbi:MAG: cupin protein [Chitinophagaceae bacterium]|nr:cupin protein [Chitinophagaceae bacterium]
MHTIKEKYLAEVVQFCDDGVFPNNSLPVLFYRGVLDLPLVLAAHVIKSLFVQNGWRNIWENGIYEYQHYHSSTHEVMGVLKGKTTLLLGGEKGVELSIQRGDVLIIPAGVAHRNLQSQYAITCVGAYSQGDRYDILYGNPGDRPKADHNIHAVPLPELDPVFGLRGDMKEYWTS